MKKYLKRFIIIFALGLFLSIPFFVNAQNSTLNAYFFYSKNCSHCHKEAVYLSSLKAELEDQLKIYSFEVTSNSANAQLFQQFAQEFGTTASGVPMLFIGSQYIIGYGDDSTTGQAVNNLINYCLNQNCRDVGHTILYPDEKECEHGIINSETEECEELAGSKIVKVPLLGKVNLEKTSLLSATVILGILDGFNPCAMWVLLFLISLLLGIESNARRWFLGITFIVGSAFVYFLFMVAWLQIFLFIGYLLIVRIIIGGLAIAFGIYNLNKYFKNKAGVCQVTNTESRQKILEKLKAAALRKNIIPATLGILVLAFGVNLIELACSAGFPAMYTNILAMHSLSGFSHYAYILLYILFFMIDDIIVFVIAMVTLKLTGVSDKYSKYSNLIGGLVILILGIIMILNPKLLMFG